MMTIDELMALCDAATPGPWLFDSHNTITSGGTTVATIPDHPEDGEFMPEQSKERSAWYHESAANAEFIAAARTALPEQVIAVERLHHLLNAKQSAWRNSIAYVLNNPAEIELIGVAPHLEIRGALAPVAAIVAENIELNRLFDLQQTRMAEATNRWREATGNHEILPDLGNLLEWMLRSMDSMQERCEFGNQCYQDRCEGALVEASVVKRLETQNTELRKAVLNQAGDNLCWLKSDDPLRIIIDGHPQIPPISEFLESCARYHSQLTGERGELQGCRTIAQLEAEVERLKIESQTRFEIIENLNHVRTETARECADIAHWYDDDGKTERGIRTHFGLEGPRFGGGLGLSQELLDYLHLKGSREVDTFAAGDPEWKGKA